MSKNVYVGTGLVGTATKDRLVAAGPLTKQPHTLPYRHVIVGYGDGGYSVHNEVFTEESVIEQAHGGADAGVDRIERHSSLCHGHYFGATQLPEAMQRFAEKLANSVGNVRSIYRPEEVGV